MEIKLRNILLLLIFFFYQCGTSTEQAVQESAMLVQEAAAPKKLSIGAENMDAYLPLIQDKTVGLVVNQTSRIGETHLVDSLVSLGISIKTIFAPEHGFRGKADAGEKVVDGKDIKTGIPILSLYGKNKKPSPEQLKGLDWVIFDIQDVGARFYTYISTMHYVMQATAKEGIPFMVLDRPNPNGHYVDGPVRKEGFQSFVGMHSVPIVHGMTVGEYATMVNEEGWLGKEGKSELTVIPVANYTHSTVYELPIKPSPNLPNNRSIYLYPSLCLFEGTEVSVGRGTNTQFQVYGHPKFTKGNYTFTPVPMDGAKYPKHKDQSCKGFDLRTIPIADLQTTHGFQLSYLLNFYTQFANKEAFFLKNYFFDKLAGTDELRKQIQAGKTETEIRASWQKDLKRFKETRAKYLLYP